MLDSEVGAYNLNIEIGHSTYLVEALAQEGAQEDDQRQEEPDCAGHDAEQSIAATPAQPRSHDTAQQS